MSCREEVNYGYSKWILGYGGKSKLITIAGEIAFAKEQAFFKETQIDAEIAILNSELKKVKLKQKTATTREQRREIAMQLFDIAEDIDETKSQQIGYSTVCINPDCNGHTLIDESELSTCGLCKWNSCTKCHMRVEDGLSNHTCDEQILANLREIQSTTKECPVCKTRITRAYGCNQMFCTHCLTLFDWSSMKIERGWRHNPDYHNWLKANPDRRDEINAKTAQDNHNEFDVNNVILKMHTIYGMLMKQFPIGDSHPEYLKTEEEQNSFTLFLTSLLSNDNWIDNLRTDFPHMFMKDITSYSEKTNYKNRLKFLSKTMTEAGFKRSIGKNEIIMKHSRDIISCLIPLDHYLREIVNSSRPATLDNYLYVVDIITTIDDLFKVARFETYEVEKKWKTNSYSDSQIEWNYTAPHKHAAEKNKFRFVSRGRTFRVGIKLDTTSAWASATMKRIDVVKQVDNRKYPEPANF